MKTYRVESVLERLLLIQLGARLKRLRESRGLGTVEMSSGVGISRNTLRAIESGDPTTSIGKYLIVMSALGVIAELTLLAEGGHSPLHSGSSVERSHPKPTEGGIHIPVDTTLHQIQDLQSLVLHEAAVQLARSDSAYVLRAKEVAENWLAKKNSRASPLLKEWIEILDARAWRKVLGRTQHAQQLRQASPLVTILPEEMRKRILNEVVALKQR